MADDQAADPKVQEAMQRMNALVEELADIAREIDPDFAHRRVPDDPGKPWSPVEIERICDGYFDYHEYIARGYIRLAPDELVKISDEVMELRESNPERLWPLLLELIERAPTDDVRGFVAAGPLEDLVRSFPERFVDRVEEQAIRSKNFHTALRGIYGWEELPEEVWSRLSAVLTPEWDALEGLRARLP